MAIAMSFLCYDSAYYYEASERTSISVGRQNSANVHIAAMTYDFLVSLRDNDAVIKMGAGGEIVAPYDQFIILDNEAQLACYFTKKCNDEQTVYLPQNGEWNIGRKNNATSGGVENQIVVGLPFISTSHCKVIRANGVTSIVDIGSKNGLFLNGKRVSKATIKEGDIVSIFTVHISLRGNNLIFKNVGSAFKAEKLKGTSTHKAAPKKPVSKKDCQFSRSPRMITHIEHEEILLEKPPQSGGTPQINWVSILVTPAISVLLMLVLVIAMGMNATMLIMSGAMSIVSAVVAILNYRKQKSQHEGMESLVDKKYRAYLHDVSTRLDNSKKKQLDQLVSSNPAPSDCVGYAKKRDRRLWERSINDRDFLSVRVGMGTIPAALTARYKQAEVVISESDLEIEAKKLAAGSKVIEKAPILCNLAEGKLIGVSGNRVDEEQLMRSILVELATAHSYDEVKVVILASEEDMGIWSWARWLPHCANNDRSERYIFASVEDAESVLDNINETLSRRSSTSDDYNRTQVNDQKPHFVFIALQRQVIERHPIRKHLFSTIDNGCSCLFVYDNIARLPKECNEIIEVQNGVGEIYNRHNTASRTKFTLDRISVEGADSFARALASLHISLEGPGAALPTSVSFLSGYKVARPEQLNIGTRWKNAKPYKSLAVPIAAMAGGEPFYFDIHEKHHGVNGIVAGMPGSGKTEMVQSWLLSLAVNYSPQDVSFILIDFKGTGMIAPFKTLPHLAGSISNLDTNIDRNLVAIQSEVHRRETIIDKFSSKGIKNVNDLNKAYEKGIVPEKLPILLVVIDEYAEFKKVFPDFGTEIDSLTSKGRALGMFIVLMTQKPAGVVSAKSEDNIKFRWCLRVANYAASREMLGRGDAAKLSTPGRAFVKVGEDDVYEEVQSYWSGAPYLPNKEKAEKNSRVTISYVRLDGKRIACEQQTSRSTEQSSDIEIDVIVRHIVEYCEQSNIAPAERIWTEKLPERLVLTDILRKSFSVETGWPTSQNTSASIALVDDPEKQQQYPLVLDFAKTGHILVYGSPVSGKTTLLQTLIVSLAMSCPPDSVNVYAFDFGGWNLNILKDLPHVGGIANDNEPDRIKKLMALIADVLESRKIAFSSVGVGNIGSYKEATGNGIPDIIVAVDNIGSALKLYPELEPFFAQLSGNGANYGIYLVATAIATNTVPIKISQNIKYCLALQMVEKSDYTYTVGKVSSDLPAIAGRGYAKGKPPLMFQTALPANGRNEKAMADGIRTLAKAMNTCWDGKRASSIPEMPDVIPFGSIEASGTVLGLSVDKVAPVDIDFTQQHFLMISGMPQSGKTNLLTVVAKQLKTSVAGKLYAFDIAERWTEQMQKMADTYITDSTQMDAFIESLRPELQNRLEQRQKDPTATFEPIIFAIDDYSRFFEKVSNDSISRLLAIVKLGKDLALHLVVASDAHELTSLVNKGEAVALSMVRSDYSVMLGGCMNDHTSIVVKEAYSQKNAPVNEHEGYFIHKSTGIRFKTMRY